jgi:hypothetical protein
MDDLRSRAVRAAQKAAEQRISDAKAAKEANARSLLIRADRACQHEFGIKANWAIRDGEVCTRIEGVWVFYKYDQLSHTLATLGMP